MDKELGLLYKRKKKVFVNHKKTDSIILNKLQVDFICKSKEYFSGKLLDAGCGEKPYSIIYNDYVETVVGCDVPYCIHDQKNIDVFATLDSLPFGDEEFDTILCTNVIEHVENVEEAFMEMGRVLKKGGKMILSAPYLYPVHEAPYDFQRFTCYGLASRLEKNGLRVEVQYPWGGLGMFLVVYANLFVCKMLKWKWLKMINIFCQKVFYAVYQKSCLKRVFAGKCQMASVATLGYFVVASKQ